VELALVAKMPALYWVKKHRWQNLQVAERSFLSPDYCYAAPHGNDRLVSLFSEGLANIKGTGQYREIYAKWLGVYEKPSIGWRDVLKYSLFTTVPVLLLLAGSILWSRTLRRQVELRTAELRNEVAERQQRELEVRAKNAELDQKNAELERFTYTVSHDLKSPLVTLKAFLGFVEIDLKAGDQDKLKKDVHFMHGAIDKMNHLLIDLLELSQVGRLVAPSQPIAFRELVADALSLVCGSTMETGLTIDLADEPLLLFGDRTRLTEIWQNLIDNAIKYRRTDTASIIQVGLTPSDDGPVFFVRDNGLGIDPRFQDQIFGLFNQLNPKAEGSGVGLALVARIVELYEGQVWVESQGLGHGTCFRFTLPGAVQNPTENI
jgi:signal transduction histidine kinase